MRPRLFALAAALALGLGLAGPASAQCAGRDLMAELEATEPETHARILARAAEVANGDGIFWRVTAPGRPPSFLYGTLHSTEAASRWLSERAIDALGHARLLMVELTPAEQDRLETRLGSDPRFSVDLDGPRLSERLSPEEMAMAERVLAGRGLPIGIADRLKPWLLISAIAVPLCERSELAAGKRLLDDAISAEAKAWGIPVRGLETYEETFAAFDALSESEMTGLLVDGFASVPHEEDLRRTLEGLYTQGRIAAIMEFNIWHSAKSGRGGRARADVEALTHALITRRNRQWMERLEPELRRGGVFAAFGALHLPGETGMVRLIREAGYAVERVGG